MDAGRNAGVTGGIDFPGLAAAIEFTVSGWSLNEAVKAMEDAGRGDGQFTPSIPLNTTGGVTYAGKVRKDAWPSQASFNGITTTTVMTLDQTTDATTGAITASTKATCTLLILSLTLKTNEKDKTLWDITVSGSLQGDIVYSGFGTDVNGVTHDQPATTQQTYQDKVRYSELSKVLDKWQLQTSASLDIRCWGIADNDQAEWNKIGQVALNQASPLGNLKLRTASLVERVSSKVIVLRLAFALRDTKDDELFPFEVDQNKVDGLGNLSTRAGLNASPIAPNTSLFFSGTETRRLTDGTVKIISTFDRWGGEKNQRQKTGTYVDRDVSGLNDKGVIDLVVLTANGLPADPTPLPSGLQVVGRTLRDFDNTHADAIFTLGVDTPQQTLEQDASSQNDDPNIIDSARGTALVDATAARATGYRTVGIETKSVRHNRLMTIHRMGKLDSLDRLKLPRTRTKIDRNGATATSLDDEDVEVKEWLTTDTPPTAPDFVPSNNTKLLYYIDEPVYPAIDGVAGLNVRVFFFGAQSSRDRLVLGETVTNTDASGIQSTAVRAYLDGESVPSTPAGMFLRFTRPRDLSVGLGINRTLTVLVFGLTTVQTEMENENTLYTQDAFDNLKSRVATVVDKTDTLDVMIAAALVANPDSVCTFKPIGTTSTKVLKIIEKTGDDFKIISLGGDVVKVPLRGRPQSSINQNTIPATAFNITAAYVKVQVYGTAAGGKGFRIFVPSEIRKKVSRYIIRRYRVTSTPDVYRYISLEKKVSNAPLLGRAAFQTMFIFAKVMQNLAVPPPRLVVYDYLMETDDTMFMDDSNILIGEGGYNDSPQVFGSGYVPATNFDATSLLVWPESADLSVFLAP
jgi:hypothetical protein